MPKPSAAPPLRRGHTHLVQRRAEALDALDSVLPFDRREVLAEILTDDDVETLRHLAKEGIGDNSLRALASDLGYLEAWSAGRHRKTAALAGAGGTADQVRRPSSVGSRPARDRPRTACRKSRDRDCCRRRAAACRRAARAQHRPPAAVELVDADRLARFGGTIQRAGPAQRAQAGGAGQRPAPRPARAKRR